MSPEDLAQRLRSRFPDVVVTRGEVTVVLERDDLLDALGWLRDEDGVELGFLSSLSATHWPDAEPAFWMDYELRSMTRLHRIRVKVGLPAEDPHVSRA